MSFISLHIYLFIDLVSQSTLPKKITSFSFALTCKTYIQILSAICIKLGKVTLVRDIGILFKPFPPGNKKENR